MRCEEKADKYCMKAIRYEKYAEYRRCNQCCIGCNDPCGYLCGKALEVMNKRIEGKNNAT